MTTTIASAEVATQYPVCSAHLNVAITRIRVMATARGAGSEMLVSFARPVYGTWCEGTSRDRCDAQAAYIVGLADEKAGS